MEYTFESLTHWLALHQHWILIAILLTAFLESLALVGIVVPGIALLFACATAAGSVELSLLSIFGAGFIGSVAGDGISFLLGHRYHHHIRQWPWLRSHPQWIEKGEDFFKQYGLMSIVVGRFVGPVRPIMPLVAGLMQMRPRNFFVINILSALAWSPAYLMPGYLVGASLEGRSAFGAEHLGFLLLGLLLGWLMAQVIWWLHQRIYDRRQKVLLGLLSATSCLCLFIMVSQVMQLPAIMQLNQQFEIWAITLRQPWLDHFFVGLTRLGYFAPTTLCALLVLGAILWQRNLYAAALWSFSLLSGTLLVNGLKRHFAWPRPNLIQSLPDSFAFPSGHTAMSLIFLGTLALLCFPGVPRRRQKAMLSALGILAMLMAWSRLYLTVHWPTDILGGLLIGGLVLSLLYTWVLKYPFQRIRPLPIVIASLMGVVLSVAIWVIPDINQYLIQYQPKK